MKLRLDLALVLFSALLGALALAAGGTRGLSVLPDEIAATVRGFLCKVCVTTGDTCNSIYGAPCSLVGSACILCQHNFAHQECQFTFNVFASCTSDAALDCGHQVPGICILGVCNAVGGALPDTCGTVGQCH